LKLIVGLGNPGQTYRDTRHNVGFLVVQLLAERHGVVLRERLVNPDDGRPAGVAGEYRQGEDSVRLLMPLTMMNDSGDLFKAVRSEPSDLLIVCDDVNLPLGTIRLRALGGSGGHHGLESCLAVLETQAVARLRIGVGAAALPKDLTEFVLSPFGPSERTLVRQTVAQAADACETWVREGIEVAMNQFNRSQDVTG
jgi:PTH1 family peptidyl-tRNA hydrolase